MLSLICGLRENDDSDILDPEITQSS